MSEITLQAGQVWVPTKESGPERQITNLEKEGRIIYWEYLLEKTVCCCPFINFRAWITRTGAVLREVTNE